MTDFHFKNQTKYELHVEAAHNTETHISPPGERAGKKSYFTSLESKTPDSNYIKNIFINNMIKMNI